MGRYIENARSLVSRGNVKGRRIVVDILEHAFEELDSYEAALRLIKVRGNIVSVGNLRFDLEKVGNLYVVGAGKASLSMARALDHILGRHIRDGVVVVKRGQIPGPTSLGSIRLLPASHPIPDASGQKAAREVLRVADRAQKGDLVFSLISGGASALMPVPAGEITLEDKIETTRLLLDLGISVDEINTVRNHISEVKGGRLAMRIHPAELVNLIVVDQLRPVPWGPTVPDQTTADEAIAILKQYDIWKHVPVRVRDHLLRTSRGLEPETPKEMDLAKVKSHNFILGDNPAICTAAWKRSEELGLQVTVLTSNLEGESKDVGVVLGSIALKMEEDTVNRRRPHVLIAGGETTVRLTGQGQGKGGPSQELVLGAALKIRGSKRTVVASVDTDGTDGPTDVAGGIVDGFTVDRAIGKKLDPRGHLLNHDSYSVLDTLEDTIRTGLTGTNVMDLNLVVIT